MVQNIKDKYDWQPASLFSYLQEGEAYQLLLRMVQVNLDKERLPDLAAGCINAIKIEHLQKQINDKKEQLKNISTLQSSSGAAQGHKDTINLLAEVADLEKQIRILRSDN